MHCANQLDLTFTLRSTVKSFSLQGDKIWMNQGNLCGQWLKSNGQTKFGGHLWISRDFTFRMRPGAPRWLLPTKRYTQTFLKTSRDVPLVSMTSIALTNTSRQVSKGRSEVKIASQSSTSAAHRSWEVWFSAGLEISATYRGFLHLTWPANIFLHHR